MKFGFPMFQKMQKKVDNVNRVVQENLIGMRVVKAFVREDHEKDKFHKTSDDLAKQGAMASGLIVTVMPVMMLLFNAVIVFTYYKGALSANEGVMQVGQISVFASYVVQILSNLVMISMMLLQLARGKACAERVVEVLDTEIDIVNPENAFVPTEPKGEVEFKNVNFSYAIDDDDENQVTVDVLKNFNLTIEKGSFVAILGHNGSGKSTTAKLINGINIAQSGEVIVDGQKVVDDETIFDIRRKVGMVFQNPDNQMVAALVEVEVAFAPENLGVEPKEIRRRVDECLEIVNMTKYAQSSPSKLSGGQKQRVAIASVLAMNPEILILDEPTAMLDPKGRSEVIKTIKMLNEEKDITVVLITHYMDEAAQADRTVVIDDGEIVLDGTPKEVFKNVEKLKSLGLDVPQVTELAYELRKMGIEISDDVLTVDECFDEIIRILGETKR